MGQVSWRETAADTHLFSHHRGCPTSTKLQLSNSNKNLVLDPRRGLTPRLTGQLTVSHKVTLTEVSQKSTADTHESAVVVGGWLNAQKRRNLYCQKAPAKQ
jgi:hypothetical protein